MAKRNFATLCAVLAIFSLFHAVAAENDFYRLVKADVEKCARPWCGGYFIEKVNVEDSEVYVAGLDYTLAPEGAEAKVKAFLAALYDGPIVIFGDLIPLPPLEDGTDSELSNLQVVTVYLGIPGQTSNVSGLTFYTIKGTQRDTQTAVVAEKLNARNTSQTAIAKSSVNPVAPAAYLDLGWQLNQIFNRGALVAGTIKTSDSLSTIQINAVYIQVPVRPSFCTLEVPPESCEDGGSVVYYRTSGHCVKGFCIHEKAICTLSMPSCPKGYQLAGWPAAPGGCNEYKCDPIFAPGFSALRKH